MPIDLASEYKPDLVLRHRQHRAAAQGDSRGGNDLPGTHEVLAEEKQPVGGVLLGVAGRSDRAFLTLADLVDLVDDQHHQQADENADHDLDEAEAPLQCM